MRQNEERAKGDGLETGNVYGDIPVNGTFEENNRRSTVNPAAQNPNNFRVSDYKAYGEANKKEDPIGKAFSKAKSDKSPSRREPGD